jgi:hypothetical protein
LRHSIPLPTPRNRGKVTGNLGWLWFAGERTCLPRANFSTLHCWASGRLGEGYSMAFFPRLTLISPLSFCLGTGIVTSLVRLHLWTVLAKALS